MNVWFHRSPPRPGPIRRADRRLVPAGRPRRVLVTGFGPFPGVPENPSAAIVARIAGRPPPGVRVLAGVLPTAWSAPPTLPGLLSATGAEAVLHVGVAAGSVRPRLEAVAWNRAAALADVDGRAPVERRLGATEPVALRPRVAAATLAGALRRGGRPVDVSHSAGAYLCNAVLFGSLAAARRRTPSPAIAFLHVPLPGLRRGGRLEDLTAVAAAVLEALARPQGRAKRRGQSNSGPRAR